MKRLAQSAVLSVELAQSPSEAVRVGRLALDRGIAVFEYDPLFIASGRRIDPLVAATSGAIPAPHPREFNGLHGVFADSLPDLWGNELLRRRCARAGVDYTSLTRLERLAIVGTRGMGALTYRPEIPADADAGERIDFDQLAADSAEILEGRDVAVVSQLLLLGGSSGGARPKVLVALDDAGHARSGVDEIPDGYTAWLVKFPHSHDGPDSGPLEAAYAAMARAAGIVVPDHRLIPAMTTASRYFASKRFDRSPGNVRRHMISAAAVLGVDWRVPAVDYETMLRLVRAVTRSQAAVEEMFRRMIFNVIAHNRDDHTKQQSFLLGDDGTFTLAPAYDLTFSAGPRIFRRPRCSLLRATRVFGRRALARSCARWRRLSLISMHGRGRWVFRSRLHPTSRGS